LVYRKKIKLEDDDEVLMDDIYLQSSRRLAFLQAFNVLELVKQKRQKEEFKN